MIQLKPSLKPGQKAPDYGLPAPAGRWVVLFFYPADFTPGCTVESCAFRDQYQDFKDAGAELIGVSGDTLETHEAFKAGHGLPYALVSDPDSKIRRAYTVPHVFGRLSGRTTFVIDPQGVIRFVFDSRENAAQHVGRSLEFIRHAR